MQKNYQILGLRFYYLELLFLFCIFVLSLLLRLYKINNYLFFGFEQGRDALVIRDIYKLKDFVLVGPKTDIGGIFHGAWYYYFLAPIYFSGNGNPLIAIYFLIFLNSIIPIILYLFGKEISKNKYISVISAILGSISFELISYSRWLSNVNPAGLFVLLTFFFLFKLIKNKKDKYFALSCFFACLACQFEIILLLWFVWVYFLIFVSKLIAFPKIKTLLKSLVIALFLFSPMILFNLRNDFIGIKSALNYDSELKFSFIDVLKSYFETLFSIFQRNVLDYDGFLKLILLTIFGVLFALNFKKFKKIFSLLILWIFMSFPVVFFGNSVFLMQLYVGTGLGIILLVSLVLGEVFRNNNLVLKLVVIVFFIINFCQNLKYLDENSNVFYRTIQDDLNYSDQRNLLNYMNKDGREFNWKAFAIPYFQEQGWQYLQLYYYSDYKNFDSEIYYLIIEEKVDNHWKEKWTEDIGKTELLEEKYFGKLKLEKRKLI